MAQKRMFTLSVVDTDWFLEMPLSTQALYFHLSMRADDDGFVDSPKSIIRKIGANTNDYQLLVAKRFVLEFESGVLVIKHWRMHNTIQKDRYMPTRFQEEFGELEIKDDKSYTEKKVGNKMETKCFPSFNSISNSNTNNIIINNDNSNIYKEEYIELLNYWNSKDIIKHKMSQNIEKEIKKALKDNTIDEIKTYIDRYDLAIKDNNYFFKTHWTLVEFLKQKNAMNDFKDDGSKWINYINSTSGKKKQEQQMIASVGLDEGWKW